MVVDYVQKLEITIRALSNLHERLHHSTTLYLLPSAYKFVKHEEYLIPNLLLLVPLVVRAATLALNDIRQFDLRIMGWMLLIALGATLGIDSFVAQQYEGELESSEQQTKQNTWLAMTYAASLVLFYQKVLRQRSKAREMQVDTRSALQSAQLVVCLVAIYVHVPITFGHISLAYPSALFWVPCLAFPSFPDGHRSKVFSLVVLIWLVLTWPPVALLSQLFSGALPAYVRFVYFPLHILLSLSCILGFSEGGKL
jgi:glycosylphosphatidylinositol transamidase